MTELAVRVLELLRSSGSTLAVAESLTGGLVSSTLVAVPGASAVLRGAVVAYATELKHQLLGVDDALLARRGAVDPDVAVQMAAGVARLCGADWGVSTTGVAGPEPQDGHPPGLVYIAVAGPVTLVRELHLPGNRQELRDATVWAALELLHAAAERPRG